MQGVHTVTDEGVRHLAQCARLKSLDISHCWKVTDSGLSHLPSLVLLAHLDIAYCWQVRIAHSDSAVIAKLFVHTCMHACMHAWHRTCACTCSEPVFRQLYCSNALHTNSVPMSLRL